MTLALPDADAGDISAMMVVMGAAFDPAFGEAWSAAQVAGSLAMPGAWARLARLGDAPVGFTLCRRVADDAELLLIAVDPPRRGGVVAGALLDRALDDARSFGAGAMFLEVRDGNAAALRLYARHDFTMVGRRRDYYSGRGGRRFDALTMRRVLADAAARRVLI